MLNIPNIFEAVFTIALVVGYGFSIQAYRQAARAIKASAQAEAHALITVQSKQTTANGEATCFQCGRRVVRFTVGTDGVTKCANCKPF